MSRYGSLAKQWCWEKRVCHNDTATVDLSADWVDYNLYTLKRSYHKNKSSEDVTKIIAILEGK